VVAASNQVFTAAEVAEHTEARKQLLSLAATTTTIETSTSTTTTTTKTTTSAESDDTTTATVSDDTTTVTQNVSAVATEDLSVAAEVAGDVE
jgi:hypothetical protein